METKDLIARAKDEERLAYIAGDTKRAELLGALADALQEYEAAGSYDAGDEYTDGYDAGYDAGYEDGYDAGRGGDD